MSDDRARALEPTPGGRYAPATAALSPIAMPVVIVGAADGARRSCATATVMYVSLAPPQIAVALHPGSRTTVLVRATGELSISMLATDQLDVAVRAGRSGRESDKFAAAAIPVQEPPAGFAAPAVAGSLTILWCRVTHEIETGDHVLVIARVEDHLSGATPGGQLLRADRRYAALGDWLSGVAPENYPV
jgi:flavin reductase (DIM6/NTAB) family NADH-FMN oxidoreductase RutF